LVFTELIRRHEVARKILDFAWASGRKLIVAVIGSTVILLGVALIFLPGPAIVVIPLGLGILSLEFAWAKRAVRELQNGSRAAVDKLRMNGAQTGRADQQAAGEAGSRGDADERRARADRAPLAGTLD
jgi:hypothetical protein